MEQTKINEQELNKKLAEWAEFEFVVYPNHKGSRDGEWLYPDGSFHLELPDFTQSLNACFKWLVPKAIDKIMAEQECSSDVAYAILFKKWLQELELIIPQSALALCLAIERLIDGEKNG